ncbi:NAD(P)H-hydrate epimerase [Arcanobacterium hippocoleae]
MQYTFSVKEVRQADQILLAAGAPLMEQAAYGLANCIIRELREANFRIPGSTVLILAGKGNNGGDALYAGAYLAQRGMHVNAVAVSGAHEAGMRAAKRANVQIIESPSEDQLRELARGCGIWVDGLLGIGARGEIREPFSSWIRVLNAERFCWPPSLKIFAVDIPSGIAADTGKLLGAVLPADVTVTMGCMKTGMLLPPAAKLCGRIEVINLGYERFLLNAAQMPRVCRIGSGDLQDVLFSPLPQDHKYSRGVLSVNTGSAQYPGAGVLSVGAALRTGIGMLRYCGGIKDEILRAYPEVVAHAGNSDAWLIGSGMTDFASAQKSYQQAAEQKAAAVLDAGAINLLAGSAAQTLTVITPHAGELVKLLRTFPDFAQVDVSEINANPAYYAKTTAELTQAAVVLKGSVTLIATPKGDIFTQGPATPWLATAGSGDVLAGIIAALAANWNAAVIRSNPADSQTRQDYFAIAKIAAGGVEIHARAAALAAKAVRQQEIMTFQPRRIMCSGKPIIAGDIIEMIADVLYAVLNPVQDVSE